MKRCMVPTRRMATRPRREAVSHERQARRAWPCRTTLLSVRARCHTQCDCSQPDGKLIRDEVRGTVYRGAFRGPVWHRDPSEQDSSGESLAVPACGTPVPGRRARHASICSHSVAEAWKKAPRQTLTVGALPDLAVRISSLAFGAICYGGSIVLFIAAAQRIGAARGQILFAGAPFFGMLFSFLLLSERLSRFRQALWRYSWDLSPSCFARGMLIVIDTTR
jgi:hypothetical protein